MQSRFTLAILAVTGLMLLGSGQRSSNSPIFMSFHLETTREEYPKFAEAIKMGNPAQQYYFAKMPVVTDRDVSWFYPFLADDGSTYGAAFKLNRPGTDKLTQVSTTPTNQGKLIGINVQGLSRKQGPIRSYIQIDRGVSDGVIVIWSGLTDQHLRVFTQRFPHVRDLMEQ